MSTEEQLRDDASNYHRVMRLLKNTRMEHGLCVPRGRRACTNCNATDDLKKMVDDYKGQRIRPSSGEPLPNPKVIEK